MDNLERLQKIMESAIANLPLDVLRRVIEVDVTWASYFDGTRLPIIKIKLSRDE